MSTSLKPGDIVETTEEYRTWAQKFTTHKNTYMRGIIKKIHSLTHRETCQLLNEYVVLENGFTSTAEHFMLMSRKCPICNAQMMLSTIGDKRYFSCGNSKCFNLKIYDPITMYAKEPKCIKMN